MVAFISVVLGLLAVGTPFSSASPLIDTRGLSGTLVNVRIEGASSTLFEGQVRTIGHDVTTASGGTHHCDGTNNGQNPVPGPTCTSALDNVAKLALFKWDGTWDSNFDDYFVTQIGGTRQTTTQFWGLLLNWQFTPVGGCQQQVAEGDSVLWAFDAFSKTYFLKLDGPATAKVGVPFQVTISDGPTGSLVSGATVSGTSASSDAVSTGTSDASGHLMVKFSKPGTKKVKAYRNDSLRSNYLIVTVTA